MKNKKYRITFFALLSLILITAVIFIILVMESKKDKETNGDAFDSQLTPLPTQSLTPTLSPEPTAAPVVSAELFPAYQMVNNEKTYGYIDKTGAFVINPSFEFAGDFHEGVALVTFNGENCVIDEKGTVLFVNENTIGEFSNGLATISEWDGDDTTLYGYVDTQGNVVIDIKYIVATKFNKDGTAYVSTESGKYALIDKTGKELETFELDAKYDFPWNLQDGYLVYTDSDSKYGIINIKGEEILEPVYSDIMYLGNDLFAVKKPGLDNYFDISIAKQAIFNHKGEQLSDYIYYDLSTFHEGYCSATDEDSTFFVGLDGKVAENLPKFAGRGSLRLFGDIISAEIDGEQFYAALDSTVIWQLPKVITLSDKITVKSLKLKPNRYILVNYPLVEGLENSNIQDQINKQLESLFTDHRKSPTMEEFISVEDNFSANLLNDLLIIGRDGYDYTGGAHGMPIMDYFYIDINTGTFYQLKDLFLADSDYKTKINEMITDEITAAPEESMFFPETFTGISENQYFRLEEDAFIIYFYPYDIAAYAAGFPEFTIPFEDVMEYIDTNGAFWNCFQGSN